MTDIKVRRFVDLAFLDPVDNLVYDDVLLKLAEEGAGELTLRLWESPRYFIVLGRTGRAADDLIVDVIRQDQIPVLRRSSGGGTVVQGPGCLNFSIILPKSFDVGLQDLRKSYQIILSGIIKALNDLGVQAVFRPISDLALQGSEKKFSGNAQRRGRHYILHHGTILYNFDLALISRYLAMPKDIPEYRQSRPHFDFVTNIQSSKQNTIVLADLKKSILKAYGWNQESIETKLSDLEQTKLASIEKRIQVDF